MNIKYKLLDNGTGVLLTRSPDVTDELRVTFVGGEQEGMTAVFTTKDKRSYYRDLRNGECRIAVGDLAGEITVTVFFFGGNPYTQKWSCDGLKVVSQRNGSALVAPNDAILSEEVIRLRLENQELRNSIMKLTERADEFDKWRIGLMEGYDIT